MKRQNPMPNCLIIMAAAMLFGATIVGCSNGGEKVEGRTTPATDSPFVRNDTGTRLYVDDTPVDALSKDSLSTIEH